MTIRVTSRTCPDYLRVDCTGRYTHEGMLVMLERAFALAAGAGRLAVLIDITKVTGRVPTLTERYAQVDLVTGLQAAQTQRIRMAMLGHEPRIHPERFGDIVASTRGATARTFTDERAALEWLLAAPKAR